MKKHNVTIVINISKLDILLLILVLFARFVWRMNNA